MSEQARSNAAIARSTADRLWASIAEAMDLKDEDLRVINQACSDTAGDPAAFRKWIQEAPDEVVGSVSCIALAGTIETIAQISVLNGFLHCVDNPWTNGDEDDDDTQAGDTWDPGCDWM